MVTLQLHDLLLKLHAWPSFELVRVLDTLRVISRQFKFLRASKNLIDTVRPDGARVCALSSVRITLAWNLKDEVADVDSWEEVA